jgi:ABC-type transport system substrate-binding protein
MGKRRVKKLAEKAAVELDQEKRCEMYREIQEIFNEEAVEVIHCHQPFTTLSNNACRASSTRSWAGWSGKRPGWISRGLS